MLLKLRAPPAPAILRSPSRSHTPQIAPTHAPHAHQAPAGGDRAADIMPGPVASVVDKITGALKGKAGAAAPVEVRAPEAKGLGGVTLEAADRRARGAPHAPGRAPEGGPGPGRGAAGRLRRSTEGWAGGGLARQRRRP